MQNTNLISVIIPTYGRSNYLDRTIKSVLKQTYVDVEIIVVDDNGIGTTFGLKTEILMNRYADNQKVKYIQHQVNMNGSVARNSGFRESKGEYICFLDDDDEYLPKKLEIQLSALKENVDYDGVYCFNAKLYNGKIVQTTIYNKSGNCQYDVLCMTSDIHTSSLLIKRDAVLKIKGFDESFNRHQDYEFLVRLFEHSKLLCVEEVLLNVHVESEINRPNVEKLIVAKKNYFYKLKDIINRYSKDEITEIHKAHNLELFRVCVKRFDFRMVKYFIEAKPSYKDLKKYVLPVALKTIKKFIK